MRKYIYLVFLFILNSLPAREGEQHNNFIIDILAPQHITFSHMFSPDESESDGTTVLAETPNRRRVISNIDSLIVDGHNHAFSHWYRLRNKPAVLIHIDDHSDMAAMVETLDKVRMSDQPPNITSVEEYAAKHLQIATFISAAIHEGIVGIVYHILPRKREIHAYGRIVKGSFTGRTAETKVSKSGVINWKSKKILPTYSIITMEELLGDLVGSGHPLLLDIDLDAFNLNQWDDITQPYTDRLLYAKQILQKLSRPELITIARSQTPVTFVNPKIVNQLEQDCITMLEDVYISDPAKHPSAHSA
jgi:hypothetical protein